jgi:hypothetical protein
MSAAPKPYLTPQQYLEQECQAETKSQYFDGETFDMAGASREHGGYDRGSFRAERGPEAPDPDLESGSRNT